MYFLPFVLVAAIFYGSRPTSYRPAEIFFLIYVVIGLLGLLIGQKTDYFLNEYVITSLIALCFVPSICASRNQIRLLFLFSATSLFFFYLAENKGIRLFAMPQGIATDPNAFDHPMGLLAPIYSVFFFAAGGKIEFILALFMNVLGGKRIALLGMLVGIISISFFNRIALFEKRDARFLILLLGLAAINVASVNVTSMLGYAHSELRLNADIEEIMLGRYAIGNEISRVLENRSWLESIIGSGAGSASMVASTVSRGTITQAHNDWVKIVVDYGILGSSLITVFMALIFSSSRMGMSIALVSAVIMITDNVLVYVFYQFPIVLMLAYARLHKFQETGYRPPPQRSAIAAGRLAPT